MAAIDTPIAPVFDVLEKESGRTIGLAETPARILSVSEFQTDHTALRRIVDDTHWRLTTARSCGEALQKLGYIDALVIFCESSLPDGTWKDILESIASFEKPPSLVVTSRLADESLWSEVLNLGGYDVLSKPFIQEDVLRVLTSVWLRSTHPNPRPRTRVLRAAS